jgi:hypothetical protein
MSRVIKARRMILNGVENAYNILIEKYQRRNK